VTTRTYDRTSKRGFGSFSSARRPGIHVRAALLTWLMVAAVLTGCGNQKSAATPATSTTPRTTTTAKPSRTAHTQATTGARQAIQSAVESLFSALKRKDWRAACSDYTPNIQAAVISAARKISGKTSATCAAGLMAITELSPGAATALAQLGKPVFSALAIDGSSASITYSSRTGNGLVAHSNVLLMYEFSRWLIDRATSLTFSGH
jgi:hypothetical protein